MSEVAPEFSRLVPLRSLGSQPFRQRIEANVEERDKLSERLDLLALHRLAAEVQVRRQGAETILLEAAFEAEFEQCCAVTLEPVRGAIRDSFLLLYGPSREEGAEIALSGDETPFEPLMGDAIDIGEAVAQELSLALPEFPRHPDADAEIDGVALADPIESPFASLARLRKGVEC
jgi:uncharacterized metal-binding protein YceD (DUF177 family)